MGEGRNEKKKKNASKEMKKEEKETEREKGKEGRKEKKERQAERKQAPSPATQKAGRWSRGAQAEGPKQRDLSGGEQRCRRQRPSLGLCPQHSPLAGQTI